jgi:serralysin
MAIDGILNEWSASDRLDLPGSRVPGYELYGRVEGEGVGAKFVFAIRAPVGTIGAGTTFWLNTDQDATTGYQIFGNRGGPSSTSTSLLICSLTSTRTRTAKHS